MTSEQRLSAALRMMDEYEPSPDLWSRVLYSIEEDTQHRRRLWRTSLAIGAVLAAVVVVAWLATAPHPFNGRTVIEWRILEAMETVVLVTAIVTLGPAIRRFGRGYVDELFVTSGSVGGHLLRLLDVAYYLVFAGYVLLSAVFEAPRPYLTGRLGDQVWEALARIAGLLLAMGILHAITFMALPLIALVFNSTRAGVRLPRWVVFILLLAAVPTALFVLLAILGAAGV